MPLSVTATALLDATSVSALSPDPPPHQVQMFRRPVGSCRAGDRLGICVTQLDPALVERGLAAAPGSVPTFSAALAQVERIRFYAGVSDWVAVAVRGRCHCPVIYGHPSMCACGFLWFGV